ncbi:MAG: glycosyltransferase family 4 protein [Thermoleophilia bacterium]|nr:glycosyltransferase family 4 protein [Thermoleophilia bacterium]
MQVNKYWRVRGGSDHYVFGLSRMLAGRGHEIIPFAMEDPANEPSRYSALFVSPVELSDPYRMSIWKRIGVASRILSSHEAAIRIAILADLAKPDIAHLHNIYHHLSPSILKPLVERGIGTVMTVHDYKLLCPALRFYNNGKVCEKCRTRHYSSCVADRCVHGSRAASAVCAVEMFVHDVLKAYTSRIDRFIAPSNFLAGKLLDRGLPPEQVTVIPNFVDTRLWHPDDGDGGSDAGGRRDDGIGSGDGDDDGAGDYIVYSGRLAREKGLETLVRAMATLPDIPIKIIGSGMLDTVTRQLARDLRAANIEFAGFKPEKEVRRLVQGSRFICTPSEWYENAPNVILEAFACGKPVVASRIGGIPEMVRDGMTGLLAEPGDIESLRDCIARLWNDPALSREMGAAARRLAETEYSPETHYSRIMETYKQIKRT